jgi:hypothetical protein
MSTGTGNRIYLPLIYLFLALCAIIILLKLVLPGGILDERVLLYANILLLLLNLVSLRMNKRAMEHKNLQAFLRLVYGSFLLKFFVLALAAFIYILLHRKNINKPALFGCFGIYFLYAVAEVRSVMKLSKKSNA